MNDEFSAPAFATTAAFLAVATAVTVMAVVMVSWRLRAPRTHRGLWRIALATILLLLVGETTGLFWACGAWLRYATAPRDIAPAAIPTYVAPPKVPESDDVSIEGLASESSDSDETSADAVKAEETAPAYYAGLDDTHPLAETSEIDLVLGLEWDHEFEDAAEPVSESAVDLPGPIETLAVATAPVPVRDVSPTPWQRWCGLAWGGVAILLALRLIAVRALWHWRYRRASPVTDAAIKHSVGVLARELGLRRRVAIWSSPRWVAPVAWGVWRPSIGLPVDFRETFTPAEQDAMLAHELGHLAARDPFWQCLADGVTAILWWAPWCWWVRRQLRVAAEWMADEASLLVADGPQALAECLVVLGRRMAPEPIAAHAVTGSFRSNLGKRVERLLELAESAGGNHRDMQSGRWRMPALAMCAVLSMVAGSAWARSGVESTQGVDEMRWFEQSWRRSLAGGIVSLALGAPTSAVMAQDEGEAKVVVEVEVETEESAEDESAEDDEDEADDESQEVAVEIEATIEEVEEELTGALEEVEEELSGELEEVSEELEAALSEVTDEIEVVIAEVADAAGEVAVEVELALSDDDSDDEEDGDDEDGDDEDAKEREDDADDDDADDDDADDDDAEEREDGDDEQDEADDDANEEKQKEQAGKQKERAEKAVQRAMQAKEKAMSKLKEKLDKGLKDRVSKARSMQEKLRAAHSKTMNDAAKAERKALARYQEAVDKGEPNVAELKEQTEAKLGALRERMREQERQMQQQMEDVERAMQEAQREAEEQFQHQHQDAERQLKEHIDRHDGALHQWLRSRQEKMAEQALHEKMRGHHDVQLEALAQAIESLRNNGQEKAADQIAEAVKMLAGQQEEEEVVERKKSGDGSRDELHGRVDQLQGEVAALRGEIAELRDLLKQALSDKKDGPPAP